MATALRMDSTTIGYSKTGVEKLKEKISATIESGAKAVDPKTSKAFTTLTDTLAAYWDGDDHDNFVADITTMATTLATKLRNYNTVIAAALTSYANQFKKFQQNNYTKGSIKIQ